MRRAILLAGGVLLAGIGVFVHSGGAGPSAAIEGAPLVGRQASDFGLQAPDPGPKPGARSPKPALVQLDQMQLVGDHYEAPLADGRHAVLTLDPDLQALAEKLLAQARAPRGAIVVMAPDGRILALAGRRTAKPEGGRKGTPDWHLATDVWGPAASVFKLVTASALVAGGVDPYDKVCFHGGIRSVTQSNLHDSPRDNACQNLAFGVAHSNNAILGKLAYEHLDPSTLAKYAHDLFGEIEPSLALPATFGELALPEQHDLEFARSAAGFVGSRLSVLGGALLASTFADGGARPQPRLVASIDGAPFADPPAPRRILPEQVAHAVAKMMIGTCRSGSAARSFGRRDGDVAGKTGTLSTTVPFFMEHSWFVGFAPADHPAVVVAVQLGNPESWHLRASEAARRLIDRATRRAGDRGHDLADRAPKSRR